jgi:putative intracellular protease/amidase
MAGLERAGVSVALTGLDSGPATFERLGLVMAAYEFWTPTRGLLKRFAPGGHFERAPLGNVDSYDAIVVPGGFGETFAAFCRDTRLHRIIEHTLASGRIVALQCHSVIAGTWARGADGSPLIKGRNVTCWPSAYERWLGLIPGVGRYFMPFGRPVQDDVGAIANVDFRWWRIPFNKHVVRDGQLLTSIGPWSAEALGNALALAITS